MRSAAIDTVNTILCHGHNENYMYLSYHKYLDIVVYVPLNGSRWLAGIDGTCVTSHKYSNKYDNLASNLRARMQAPRAFVQAMAPESSHDRRSVDFPI